jgi:hypothetical protein
MRPAISSATLSTLALALASTPCRPVARAERPVRRPGEKIDKAARDAEDAEETRETGR